MAIVYHMMEEAFDHEGQHCLLMARVDVDEKEPKFSTFISFQRNRQRELDLEIRFDIKNPIGIDDIIITGASAVGLCLAGKLTRSIAKEAIKCYRKSKKENSDFNILEHARAAGKCLADKGTTVKDTVTDTLIDCIGFSDDTADADD